MDQSCYAYNCKDRGIKGSPYSFHSFPRDEKRRKEWERSGKISKQLIERELV